MSELTGRAGPKFGIGEDIYWQCGGRWYAGYVVGWGLNHECIDSGMSTTSYCLNIFGIGHNIETWENDENCIRCNPKFKKGDKVWAEMTYLGLPVMVKAVITSDAHIGHKESVTEWEYSGAVEHIVDDWLVRRTFKESQLHFGIPFEEEIKVGNQVDVITYLGRTKNYFLRRCTIIGACVLDQFGFKYLVRCNRNGDMCLVTKDRIRAPLIGKDIRVSYINEYVNADATITKEVYDKIYRGGKEKMDDKELKKILEAMVNCEGTDCRECVLDLDLGVYNACIRKKAEAAKEVLRRIEEKEKFGDGIKLDIKLGCPREPKGDFQKIISDIFSGNKPLVGFKGKRMKMWTVTTISAVRRRIEDGRWEFVGVDDSESYVVDETCEVVLWENGYTDIVYCKKDLNETDGTLVRGKKYVIYQGQIHDGDVWGPIVFADAYIRDENDEFFKEYFTVPNGKAVNVVTCVKKPKLLNGTALCTESCESFTEGTLYKFVNGRTIDDNGDVRPKNTSIHTTDPDWLLRYRLIMLK